MGGKEWRRYRKGEGILLGGSKTLRVRNAVQRKWSFLGVLSGFD